MFWIFKKKHYTLKDVDKCIDKKIKKIYNEMEDQSVKDYAGQTKEDISTYKRSKFKEFLRNLAENIKKVFRYLVEKGIIVLDKLKNLNDVLQSIAEIVKALAQFVKAVNKFREYKKA